MASTNTSLTQALQNSNQVLVLLHDYLPLGYSLWAALIISILKRKGKQVTVLVAKEPFGWGKNVDEVYPTDLVVSLEQLRQIISIPIAGGGDSVGEVTSAYVDNNLEITVIPTKSALDMKGLSVSTHGDVYDVVIGVGISSNHPLIGALQTHQPSVSQAQAYFFGTYSTQATYLERIPFVTTVTVSTYNDTYSLRETIQEITDYSDFGVHEKELYTLFMQSNLSLSQGIMLPDSEGYGLVSKFTDTLDLERMVKIYGSDFAKQNRILQQLLSSAQKASEGNTVLYSISSAKLIELEAEVSEVITTIYYLPKLPQVQQNIVCIEESVNCSHVYVNGHDESLKRVAIKYGFPLDGLVTCGVVEGISFDKVCQDVFRVVTKDEQVLARHMPPIIPVPILIEPMVEVSNDDSESDSGESVDSAQASIEPRVNIDKNENLPAPVQQQPSTDSIPTSSGIDFAAIAKKMRETAT